VSRLAPAAAGAILLAYLLLCVLAWVEPSWEPDWDGALYILTGRSLARGEGYTYLGRPFFVRPPGLAWGIAQVLPDGAFRALRLNRLIMAWAGLAVASAYFAVRGLGPRGTALAVALLTGTSFLFASRFNRVESEFPFMALLFLSFGLFDRISGPPRRAWLVAVASGLALAAALYVRTAALVAIPGILWLALRAPEPGARLRRALPALLALALLLPWLAWAREAAALAERPAEQLKLFDYTTAVFHVDAGDPASPLVPLSDWVLRVSSNGAALLHELAHSIFGAGGAASQLALLALCGLGVARSSRSRTSLLFWFSAGYAALLLVYFTHHPRLLLPLLPAAYLYALEGGAALAAALQSRLAGARALRPPLPAAALAAALLAVNLGQWPGRSAELETEWQSLFEVAGLVKRNLPPDAVLVADAAPIFAVLTDRRVYSFRHPRFGNALDRYEPDALILHFDHPSTEDAKAMVFGATKKRWVPSRRLTRKHIQGYEPREP
jgi:4-amino-4-deoxy-L-arabinose transferase-like glycosyltransferase